MANDKVDYVVVKNTAVEVPVGGGRTIVETIRQTVGTVRASNDADAHREAVKKHGEGHSAYEANPEQRWESW